MVHGTRLESVQAQAFVGSNPTSSAHMNMTFEKAIELGEYEPEYLEGFPEWHQFTKHVKWSYVRQALKNRMRMLRVQWAEIANQPNLSEKPHLKAALKGVERQIDQVQMDEEKLQVEFLS